MSSYDDRPWPAVHGDQPPDHANRSTTRSPACTYPRSVVVADELPTTVTGKILRRELRG